MFNHIKIHCGDRGTSQTKLSGKSRTREKVFAANVKGQRIVTQLFCNRNTKRIPTNQWEKDEQPRGKTRTGFPQRRRSGRARSSRACTTAGRQSGPSGVARLRGPGVRRGGTWPGDGQVWAAQLAAPSGRVASADGVQVWFFWHFTY